MSEQSARAFLEKMSQDEKYRENILAIEDVNQRLQRIKDDGFEFDQEDIISVHNRLTDQDLSSVSGGCEMGHTERCKTVFSDLFNAIRDLFDPHKATHPERRADT